MECGRLPNPLNGRVSVTGIDFGSVANYTCNEGFSLLQGDARRTCGPDGGWSGNEPTCRSMFTDLSMVPITNHRNLYEGVFQVVLPLHYM